MKRKKLWPLSATAFLSFALFSAAAVLNAPQLSAKNSASQQTLQQEMDRFGIRPARPGEETVTGQTAAASPVQMPGFVHRDREGNYVIGSGEKLTPDEFYDRFPIWSGIVFGPPPAASDGPYSYSTISIKADFKSDWGLRFERPYRYRQTMAWSGSHRFGDDIGADYRPQFGHPGQPFGGRPVGSWIDFNRMDTVISDDPLLLEALSDGNFNLFSALFEGQFNAEPVEQPFLDARGF